MLNNLITANNPKSPISEAYRVIRTNLQFASLDNPLKTIVVTSSSPGEGKSTTITNLAVTFAQTGSKVLLIDADLRKPQLNKMFHESNKLGLTSAIMFPERVFDFIRETEVENLSLMTSGPIPPNPSELLGSLKMKNLIKALESAYDFVLMDSPPVGMLTDAQLIAALSDGVLIVVASAGVTIEALNHSKHLLEQVNAKIVGVILNKLEKESNGYYYYNYSAYGDEAEKEAAATKLAATKPKKLARKKRVRQKND